MNNGIGWPDGFQALAVPATRVSSKETMKIPSTTTGKGGVIFARIGGAQINTGTTDRAEARRFLHFVSQLSPEMITQLNIGKTVTIEQAFQDWIESLHATAAHNTLRHNTIYLRAWLNFSGVNRRIPSQVTPKDIYDYVNAPDDAKLATRRKRLSTIRTFFRFCLIKKYAVFDPSSEVRIELNRLTHDQKESGERRSFTEDEYARLMTMLNNKIAQFMVRAAELPKYSQKLVQEKTDMYAFWRAAVAISRHSGLRLGDIAQLEWDTIKNDKLVVWTDKKDKRVRIPFIPELRAAVRLIPERKSRYCFPKHQKLAINSGEWAKVSMQFRHILDMIGLQHLSFHCLRHTFIEDCAARGIPVQHIARVVGHSSTKTSEGYLHFKNEE